MDIGIALGGGGVRGLAHIPVLEVLDEMGIKPSLIAGTSMGAIVGALYASGMSGKEIREKILEHVILDNDGLWEVIDKKESLLKWMSVFKANFSRGGLINAQGFIEYMFSEIKARRFEELQIPLLAVTADFWSGEQVIFDKGALLPAIQASMAVPGVFAPVVLDGHVLVDGGAVNMVPYDLLLEKVNFTIAVNVSRLRSPGRHDVPNALESVMGTFDIMQSAVLSERMKRRKPDIYICPELRDIRMLDFGKIQDVLEQGMPAAEKLRKELAEISLKPSFRWLKQLFG
jgi:NTE family protein